MHPTDSTIHGFSLSFFRRCSFKFLIYNFLQVKSIVILNSLQPTSGSYVCGSNKWSHVAKFHVYIIQRLLMALTKHDYSTALSLQVSSPLLCKTQFLFLLRMYHFPHLLAEQRHPNVTNQHNAFHSFIPPAVALEVFHLYLS